MFKNNFFTEHFGTTTSEYGNNMSRAFRTKCEKNYGGYVRIPMVAPSGFSLQ